MADHHSYFLRDWHSNERAICKRVPGNWIVRYEHCSVSLGGMCGSNGPTTEVLWRSSPEAFFGIFTIVGEFSC